MFGKYLKKFEPETILQVLIEYMDMYLPQTALKCAETRFFIASGTISDLDNARIRLRAIPRGQRGIEALEKGVQRLKGAGFDTSGHERNSLFSISAHSLEMAKGTSIRDEMIRATLEARHKIKMSESEYREFSNFLTSLDPTYPTWGDVGEYGPPTLVKDSGRYFETYKRFNAGKSPE